MANLKIKTVLTSGTLLGIPLNVTNDLNLSGNGAGKSYSKFKTQTATGTPIALPASPFTSTNKRVFIYIRNTAADSTNYINLWIKNTLTASTLNATSCSGCGDYTHYIQIAQIPALGVILLPFAAHDTLFADAAAGTPEIEYLIMEE
tara:strand:+ start:27 stop:467 length:441 start_codon:yes stop_codon:yes gene_type:complete